MDKRKKYPIAVLLGIPIFLLIDSPYLEQYIGPSQLLATFLVFVAFYKSYNYSSKRVKNIMILGVFVGFSGEILFSLVLEMYHYRLGNIPLWVGFGHSLIFTSVYEIIRNSFVKKHEKELKLFLALFAIIYSIVWLYIANDWFGFICTLLFLIILTIAKKSQLFFLVMFLIVCYIEQIGTATQCWYWPDTLMGQFESIPSGNPPSGISVFYFLFDFIILHTYLQIHPKVKDRFNKRKSSYEPPSPQV